MTVPSQFTSDDFARRMERAVVLATDAGLSGVLVTPGPDLRYFTGYEPTAITERITMLVIQAGAHPAMIVPTLERSDAESAPGASAVSLTDWGDDSHPYEATASLLDPRGRYAVSDSAWAMHVLGLQQAVPDSSYVSMTSALPTIRAIKDAHELELLAAAGAAVDATFEGIVRTSFAGRSEIEVSEELSSLMRKHGHSSIEFALVGSGPNGANPHHEVGQRTIEEGDTVVMDFGGVKDGYSSDVTRTVHVGEPSDEERNVYEVVRRAQQAAFEAVRPGIACQEIDRVARKVIADAGYGEHFIHRVGHSIGLAAHEPPYMVEGEGLPIEAGMCFSIEPGIYLRGRFGVRIEDIVAATDGGARRLNNTSRELHIVS